jgi:hypothetical protein
VTQADGATMAGGTSPRGAVEAAHPCGRGWAAQADGDDCCT